VHYGPPESPQSLKFPRKHGGRRTAASKEGRSGGIIRALSGQRVRVGPMFVWAGIFLLPTALGWAALGGVRLSRSLAAKHSTDPGRALATEPIEQLGADLCRLHARLEAAENDTSPTPFKAARIRAVRGAYVDALCEACERLGVSRPAAPGAIAVPLAEIYRAEAALRECGLDIRQHA
jgi:hypothetical protein